MTNKTATPPQIITDITTGIHACLITSETPQTKERWLDDNGKLRSQTKGYMVRGTAQNITFETVADFAKLLDDNSNNYHLALVTGTHNHHSKDAVSVFSTKEHERLGKPANAITRTLDYFEYKSGNAGFLTIDCDDMGTSKDDLFEAVRAVFDCDFSNVPYVYTTSSSSWLYNSATGEPVNELKGSRLYIPVADASDIPRAGQVLFDRLWLAGYGHIELSKNGDYLLRSIVDRSMFQPNKLDFIGGSYCKEGLEQRRPAPDFKEGNPIYSDVVLPDLSPSERKELEQMQASEKSLHKAESDRLKGIFAETRAVADFKAKGIDNPTTEQIDNAKQNLLTALESSMLTGDFVLTLDDGTTTVTVGEVMDNPQKYHNATTKDPLEPDYDGGRTVGVLKLIDGRPVLVSQAHGKRTYKLYRQPRRIQHVSGSTAETTRKTLEVLRIMPDYFDMGDQLVSVKGGSVMPYSADLLSYEMGSVVQYWYEKKVADKATIEVNIDPPLNVIKQLLALQSRRRLKPLEAVITAPTITTDGHIITKQGYDARTGLYLHATSEVYPVPEHITTDHVKDAYRLIMDVLNTFSLQSHDKLSRSVALSAMMTAVVRPSMKVSPIFGFTAPVQGTGKSMLTNCICLLGSGKVAPMTTAPKNNESELKKILLANLIRGASHIVFDNITGVFDSESLASFTTTPLWQDRILNHSEIVSLPNKSMVILNGNTLQLKGELPRRTLVCKLDTGLQSPINVKRDLSALGGLRADEFVIKHRSRLVTAVLTIIKGYLTSADHLFGAGLPVQSLAGYPDFDLLVRKPILWLSQMDGIDDLTDVKQSIDDNLEDDPVLVEQMQLLNALYDLKHDQPFTATELFDEIYNWCRSPALETLFNEWTNKRQPSPISVGRALRNRIDRVADGKRLIVFKKDPKRGHQYKVINV